MELIPFYGYVIQQLKLANINSSFNVIPSSGVWHITLRCDNRRHIIDVIIPYLDQLYRSKYLGRHPLIIIDQVRDKKIVDKETQIECIIRAYSLTESGTRKIYVIDKINVSLEVPKTKFAPLYRTL